MRRVSRWALAHAERHFFLVDPSGERPPKNLTDSPDWDDYDPAWSPDDTRINFQSANQNNTYRRIMTINTDGTGPTDVSAALWLPDTVYDYPVWSPDAGSLAFASARAGSKDIYVCSADGTGIRRLTSLPGDEDLPVWSADGKEILFSEDADGTPGLYSVPLDGGEPSPILALAGAWYPGWSPDRSFFAEADPINGVGITDHRTKNTVRLDNPIPESDWPNHYDLAWSPLGNRLAFVAWYPNSTTALFVVDADGGRLRKLADIGHNEVSKIFAWSPDGTHIAFVKPVCASFPCSRETHLVQAASGPPYRLTTDGSVEGEPSWSPDGRRLAFISDRGGRDILFVVAPSGSDAVAIFEADNITTLEWGPAR